MQIYSTYKSNFHYYIRDLRGYSLIAGYYKWEELCYCGNNFRFVYHLN